MELKQTSARKGNALAWLLCQQVSILSSLPKEIKQRLATSRDTFLQRVPLRCQGSPLSLYLRHSEHTIFSVLGPKQALFLTSDSCVISLSGGAASSSQQDRLLGLSEQSSEDNLFFVSILVTKLYNLISGLLPILNFLITAFYSTWWFLADRKNTPIITLETFQTSFSVCLFWDTAYLCIPGWLETC